MPSWEDALGARHGEVIFVLENLGTEPVEVLAADSRFEVAGGGGIVASGGFDAVIPPVVEPGGRAYATAAFSLPGGLPVGSEPVADLRTRAPATALTSLVVSDGTLDSTGPTVSIRGMAANDGGGRAVDGVVGAVVLDHEGNPLYAVVDAASAGVLAPSERRIFRAADPAIPVGSVPDGTVVIHGWARGTSP
jgi:hypothetical protein